MVGRRVAVEWMLPNGRHASLAGLVVEHRMELNEKKEESHMYRVKYDLDKTTIWHAAEALGEAAEDSDDCDQGQMQVDDKCSITHLPLTEPAKTDLCTHPAKANLSALAALKPRKCPDCSMSFRLKRGLVLDAPLQDALTRARSENMTLWHTPSTNTYKTLARSTQVPVVVLPEDAGGSALFKDKLAKLKLELGIELTTPAIPAVADAYQQIGTTPGLNRSLGAQLDELLAHISSR